MYEPNMHYVLDPANSLGRIHAQHNTFVIIMLTAVWFSINKLLYNHNLRKIRHDWPYQETSCLADEISSMFILVNSLSSVI